MNKDDYHGQIIFVDPVGLKLPNISLTGEKKPRKTSPRKFVPIGDRTRVLCVTDADATASSTEVDLSAVMKQNGKFSI